MYFSTKHEIWKQVSTGIDALQLSIINVNFSLHNGKMTSSLLDIIYEVEKQGERCGISFLSPFNKEPTPFLKCSLRFHLPPCCQNDIIWPCLATKESGKENTIFSTS
jgi:hypothetical protein